MRRVIFVDDEPRVLEGIENLLFDYADEWDMVFAESGAAALEALDEEPFDVLVTDMRMPGMDGADLLARAKDAHPGVMRVVLSGHSEVEAALRAMPVAHQFLSKPCDAPTLTGVLERAAALGDLIGSAALRELLGDVEHLPARPAVYDELTRIMAGEEWALEDVTQVVSRDVAISCRLINVANTAFFSRGNPVSDVRRAVPRLGAKFVRDLVLAFEVTREPSPHKHPDVDRINSTCFMAALAIGEILEGRATEEAFLAGLLHDIGTLVLAATLPGAFQDTGVLAASSGVTRVEAEQTLLGTTHAEIGAYVIGLWGMPHSVMEAVANHHQPRRCIEKDFGLTGALHVADALVDAALLGNEPLVDHRYLEEVGVLARLDEWRAAVDRVLESEHV